MTLVNLEKVIKKQKLQQKKRVQNKTQTIDTQKSFNPTNLQGVY